MGMRFQNHPSERRSIGVMTFGWHLLHIVIYASMLANVAVGTFPRAFVASGSVTPSLPNDDENPTLPPYTVRPFSEAYFTWTASNLPDGSWVMNGTFNFSNGEYVAIGLNSDKKMDGYLVICNANNSDSSATCYDYMGSIYSITPLGDDVLPVNLQAVTTTAASAGGVTLISFSKVVYSPAYNVSIVNVNGFNRMIFSRGKWGARPAPIQHQTADRSSFSVNFVTGEVISPTSTSYRYVLYPAIGLMVLVSAGLRVAIGCYRVRFSDKARLIGVIALCSGYVIALAAYIGVYYADYIKMVMPKAQFRSFGQGGVVIFCSLMLPVGRRFFFADFFGISPERAIKFHLFCGVLLVLVLTIHGMGMWYQYGTSQIVRWKDKDAVSRLPGLLAYILILVQVSIGVCRHMIGFEKFRALHYLYLPIIFLVCCHAPIACYGIIPGIVLLCITNIYKRFFTRVGPNETIVLCSADLDTQTVMLDVVKYDFTPPGSWYFLTLPDISLYAHPFSVYRCRQGKDIQVLRFIIRNTEARGGYQKPIGTSWTGKLFQHVSSGKQLSSYRLDGPYGILEHDPFNYYNYILLAGGVGITSVANMLFKIAEADEKSIGRTDAKTNLLFMWVIPDTSWIHLLGDDLVSALQTVKRTCVNLKVKIKVFVTKSHTLDPKREKPVSPLMMKALNVAVGGRPNMDEELAAFENQQKKFSITSSDGKINTLNSAVMYCCGPQSLVESATQAARKLKDLKIEINSGAHAF